MEQLVSETMRDVLLIGVEITLLLSLALLHRWKLRAQTYFTAHTTTKEREWLRMVGSEAFHYAEQVFAHYDGPAKLNEAI
ncbi:MAG TPA: hypothetical protein VFV52_15340, partial [Bacilli bacterium]|nr:hypothetical protein [Bacilli bacterium]